MQLGREVPEAIWSVLQLCCLRPLARAVFLNPVLKDPQTVCVGVPRTGLGNTGLDYQ